MKAIKTLAFTLIAACTFAAAEAQIKLPSPPPAPPNPLHLGKPKLPKAPARRRVTLKRPPAPPAARPLPRPTL